MLGRLEALLRMVIAGRGVQPRYTEESPESYPGRLLEAYRCLGRAGTGVGFGQFLHCFLSPFKIFCVVYILLWVRKRQRVFCFEQHILIRRSGGWLAKLCASVSLCVKLPGRPGGSLRTTCEVVLSLEDKTLSRSPWGRLDCELAPVAQCVWLGLDDGRASQLLTVHPPFRAEHRHFGKSLNASFLCRRI